MNDHTFTLRFLSSIEDRDELSVLLHEGIDDASLVGPDEAARSCSSSTSAPAACRER